MVRTQSLVSDIGVDSVHCVCVTTKLNEDILCINFKPGEREEFRKSTTDPGTLMTLQLSEEFISVSIG